VTSQYPLNKVWFQFLYYIILVNNYRSSIRYGRICNNSDDLVPFEGYILSLTTPLHV